MKREIAFFLLFAPIVCSAVSAADHRARRSPDRPDVVEFFQAADAGKIEVRFIARDAAAANVLIANKTDRAIDVRLPDAFAAVPVLAQFNGGPGGGMGLDGGLGLGGGQGAGGGATQGVGGGFNQGMGGQFPGGNQGMGNQGMGFGGRRQGQGVGFGMMRIPPQRTRKVAVATVCLQHGKPEPSPKIAYKIVPIEQFSRDSRLASLCRRFGSGEVSQQVAQAAAWHLSSDLTWERLAQENRVESRYRGNIRRFNEAQLADAKCLVANLIGTADPPGDYEH